MTVLSLNQGRLEAALAEKSTRRQSAWLQTLREALQEMTQDLRHQLSNATTEAPTLKPHYAGKETTQTVPTLAWRKQELEVGLRHLIEQVHQLTHMVEAAALGMKGAPPTQPTIAQMKALRQGGQDLIKAHQEFNHAENLFVQDTVNTDVGVGD